MAWLADAGCQVGHLLLWIGVPAIFVGLGHALIFYFTLWTVAGLFLGMILAPGHMGMPLVTEQTRGWYHQLKTSRDMRIPRWLSYFFIGLEYQIEHHLFPKVPHQLLPKAKEIVRRWCLKHGYPHQDVGFGAALSSTTRFIANAWKLKPAQR